MKLDSIIIKIVKQLKSEGNLSKDIKVNDKTYLTGDKSPFDSVAFVQFTSCLEVEISKIIKKNFFIILNEIPEFKKNSKTFTVGNMKKFLIKKIKI